MTERTPTDHARLLEAISESLRITLLTPPPGWDGDLTAVSKHLHEALLSLTGAANIIRDIAGQRGWPSVLEAAEEVADGLCGAARAAEWLHTEVQAEAVPA
jgi:hypothetical protein